MASSCETGTEDDAGVDMVAVGVGELAGPRRVVAGEKVKGAKGRQCARTFEFWKRGCLGVAAHRQDERGQRQVPS